jgi:hypothetical protein
MNAYTLLITWYTRYRDPLIRYAFLYVSDQDLAEDLVEEAHDKICHTYGDSNLTEEAYQKLMKTLIRNCRIDHARKEKRTAGCRYPETVSPKPLPSLEEHVCRREEVEFLMLAMARLSTKDRTILLEPEPIGKSTCNQRFQAKGRLQTQLISVITSKSRGEKPSCPYCHSLSLYFHLSECVWVCERCGQVTKVPGPSG